MSHQIDLFAEPPPDRHVIDTMLRVARQQHLAGAGFEPRSANRRPGCGIERCARIGQPEHIHQHRFVPALWTTICHRGSRWAWRAMLAGGYLERST
jgi:hypothetical protein